MRAKFIHFGIYNIDVDYLKYLHEFDTEVYYSTEGYERKPFLGLLIDIGEYTYFIPLTSAKPKHLRWANVTAEHYLIYEVKDAAHVHGEMIKSNSDGRLLHVLSVLDIKKMIPVPDGMYVRIDFSTIEDRAYADLLDKEYNFCKERERGILKRAEKLYNAQKETGIVHRYHCDFARLEKACERYH